MLQRCWLLPGMSGSSESWMAVQRCRLLPKLSRRRHSTNCARRKNASSTNAPASSKPGGEAPHCTALSCRLHHVQQGCSRPQLGRRSTALTPQPAPLMLQSEQARRPLTGQAAGHSVDRHAQAHPQKRCAGFRHRHHHQGAELGRSPTLQPCAACSLGYWKH